MTELVSHQSQSQYIVHSDIVIVDKPRYQQVNSYVVRLSQSDTDVRTLIAKELVEKEILLPQGFSLSSYISTFLVGEWVFESGAVKVLAACLLAETVPLVKHVLKLQEFFKKAQRAERLSDKLGEALTKEMEPAKIRELQSMRLTEMVPVVEMVVGASDVLAKSNESPVANKKMLQACFQCILDVISSVFAEVQEDVEKAFELVCQSVREDSRAPILHKMFGNALTPSNRWNVWMERCPSSMMCSLNR